MANNKKITDEEEFSFINFVLYGDAYIQQECKGDTVKTEKLRAKIASIGQTKVNFYEVADLLKVTVNKYLMPIIDLDKKEILAYQEVLKQTVPSMRKLSTFIETLHENGDISDDSYAEFTDHKYTVNKRDFNNAKKAVEKTIAKKQEKQKKLSEQMAEMTKQGKVDDKSTVAETTYDSESGDNVIDLKPKK